MVDLIERHLRNFPEERDHKVHDGAHGRKVVQRNQGVHLELGRAQEALHHGKTQRLEDDTANLVDETNQDELDLADRGDDNTNDDNRDVQEHLQVRLREAKRPASNQDGDGSGGLRQMLAKQNSPILSFRSMRRKHVP